MKRLFQMKRLLPLFFLFPLFPLVLQITQHEDDWPTKTQYSDFMDIIWCRPLITFNDEKVYKYVRNGLFHQTHPVTSLIRPADLPENARIQVEMVLLPDNNKQPEWIRKPSEGRESKIRIFLNESFSYQIGDYCRKEGHPSVYFNSYVAIDIWFFKPILLCQSGTPTCLWKVYFLPIGLIVLAIVIVVVTMLVRRLKKTPSRPEVSNQLLRNEDAYDERNFGAQNAHGQQIRSNKKRSDSWPDNSNLPEEFQVKQEDQQEGEGQQHTDPFRPAEYVPGNRGVRMTNENFNVVSQPNYYP